MGWLQDYNGAEARWYHVVILIGLIIGMFVIIFFFGPETKEMGE